MEQPPHVSIENRGGSQQEGLAPEGPSTSGATAGAETKCAWASLLMELLLGTCANGQQCARPSYASSTGMLDGLTQLCVFSSQLLPELSTASHFRPCKSQYFSEA
eukprot:1160127-Pelagomonas_calceolata.AAC.11